MSKHRITGHLTRTLITAKTMMVALASHSERTISIALVAALCTIMGIGLTSLTLATRASIGELTETSPAYQLHIKAGNFRRGGEYAQRSDGSGNATTLSADDAAAVSDIDGVRNVSPMMQTPAFVEANGQRIYMPVLGLNPDAPQATGWRLVNGRAFREANGREALLDASAATRIFGHAVEALGQTIKLGDERFTVVGVTSSGPAHFRDTGLIVPWLTLQADLGLGHLHGIVATLDLSNRNADIIAEIRKLLRQRHGLDQPTRSNSPDDFTIATPVSQRIASGLPTPKADRATSNLTAFSAALHEQLKQSLNRNRATASLLTAALGVIAFLAGLGMMANVLLAAIASHRHEIGIKMSIGALRSDVWAEQMILGVTPVIAGNLAALIAAVGLSSLLNFAFGIPAPVSLVHGVLIVATVTCTAALLTYLPVHRAMRRSPTSLMQTR